MNKSQDIQLQIQGQLLLCQMPILSSASKDFCSHNVFFHYQRCYNIES